MDFARHLADLIRHDGPMRLDRFMGLAAMQYYHTRDPFGSAGDFTTAPEISQLFGEMVAVCFIDHWERSGRPPIVELVELGPGRGTLMADILRVAQVRPDFLAALRITLMETSPVLREVQHRALARFGKAVDHIASLDEVLASGPTYLIANEFFDAGAVRQFVYRAGSWNERYVCLDQEKFGIWLDPTPIRHLPGLPDKNPIDGDVFETRELGSTPAEIGLRLTTYGGLALVIDYGHPAPAYGDTLQAVRSHRFVDPLSDPGEADLTAHVDFHAIATAISLPTYGPTNQGDFLKTLGIEARAAALSRSRPDQAPAIAAAVARLTAPDQMGTLFKAMALTGPGAPGPAGFGP